MPTFGVGAYRLWQNEEEQYTSDTMQVFGKFFPDTGVDPTGLKGKGITSVKWIATGHLRLTLDDSYKELLDAGIGVALASAAGINVTLGDVGVNISDGDGQATVTAASTTGGDGIVWQAVPVGQLGNSITIQYAALSGGTTTVTVLRNAITVHPKAGETNAGVAAAVAASFEASRLVTALTVTGGSDVVLATSVLPLIGGVTPPSTIDLWINDSTAGTAADIAADPGNYIMVDFEFQNSTPLVPG
jgi:hypothetical protein